MAVRPIDKNGIPIRESIKTSFETSRPKEEKKKEKNTREERKTF